MPIYTFYAFIGYRGAQRAILTVDSLPLDWLGMKAKLLEVARMLFVQHDVSEASVSLDRHLPGVKMWRQTIKGYSFKEVSFKRSSIAFFTLEYNSALDMVAVKEASFNDYTLRDMASEFYAREKGRQYCVPPIIPKKHKSFMEDPKAIFEEFSTLRYPSYSQTPKLRYMHEYERPSIGHIRHYLPYGEKFEEKR